MKYWLGIIRNYSVLSAVVLLFGSVFFFAADARADGPVQMSGSCEMNEANKKSMAEKGAKAIENAQNSINKMNDFIKNEYKAESGKCHYLEGSVGKWWDEAFRSQLNLSDRIVNGAKEADKLLSKGSYCADGVKYLNDNNGYTDWDIDGLKSRATQSSSELKAVAEWAKSATIGQSKQSDGGDARDAIKKAMGVKCSYITVVGTDASKRACLDSKGYTEAQLSNPTVADAVRACLNSNPNIPLNFVCSDTKMISWFGSHSAQLTIQGRQQFMSMLSSEESKKCTDALIELSQTRGNFIKARNEAHNAFGVLSGQLQGNCTCKKDESGHETGEIDECEVTESGYEEDNIESCPTVEEYQAEIKLKCIPCGLFAKILAAAQNIADAAFNVMKDPLSKLLEIAFLIFIGYTTLIMIGSPETQKISQYLSSLLTQGFRVAVALLILASPEFLYDNLAEPLLDGSIDFGIAITESKKQDFLAKGGEYESNFKNESYLSSDMLTTMVGSMAGFNESAATVPAIGEALWCNAWIKLGASQGFFIPRISMALEGVIFIVFGYMIMLALGFYLLDTALQLGIVCALMPFFVACWPFKMTSKYTKVGWNMFLNTCFYFIMMGILVTVVVNLISMSISGDRPADEFIAILSSGSPDYIMQYIDFGGLQMIMCILCTMFAFKISKETGNLANKFAKGSPAGGMGTKLGTMAASAAKSAVKFANQATKPPAPGKEGGEGGGDEGDGDEGGGDEGGGDEGGGDEGGGDEGGGDNSITVDDDKGGDKEGSG